MTSKQEGRENNNSEYSPFHLEFDQQCPVDGLFSEENRKDVVQGKVEDLMWVSVFRNSPINNSESEMIMDMTEAVHAGQWVDIPMKSDVQKDILLEFNEATQMMVDQGFAIVQ